MQKIKLLLVLGAFAAIITLHSCKEDENPIRPKLKFDDAAISINESAGSIEIALQLDQAYSRDIEIEYEIDGTAVEGSSPSADYELSGTFGTVDLDAGETEAIIEILIKQDAIYEGDETIELSISDVDSDEIIIDDEDDEMVITIRDDEAAPKVSVASTTMEVLESFHPTEGYFEVDLVLESPVGQDITVTYTVDGSALDSLWAYENDAEDFSDFFVHGNTAYTNDLTTGEIVIPAGETTVPIELNIYSDLLGEGSETIIIELISATNGITLGTNKKTTISLKQEDGMYVELDWGTTYTDVDMDLFFWVENENDVLVLYPYTLAASGSFASPESLFMPNIFGDGKYGFSYNYYEGTANPMNFTVRFSEFKDGVLESDETSNIFNASYTLANLNPWFTTKVNPLLAQSYKKTGSVYSDFSTITVHETGSRIAAPSTSFNYPSLLHDLGSKVIHKSSIQKNKQAALPLRK